MDSFILNCIGAHRPTCKKIDEVMYEFCLELYESDVLEAITSEPTNVGHFLLGRCYDKIIRWYVDEYGLTEDDFTYDLNGECSRLIYRGHTVYNREQLELTAERYLSPSTISDIQKRAFFEHQGDERLEICEDILSFMPDPCITYDIDDAGFCEVAEELLKCDIEHTHTESVQKFTIKAPSGTEYTVQTGVVYEDMNPENFAMYFEVDDPREE